VDHCSLHLRHMFRYTKKEVMKKFPEHHLRVVGGFYFLRFLCPALVSPEGFGIISSSPSSKSRRSLILVSKVLQNLANDVEFGEKENYMIQMNPFISSNQATMWKFLECLASPSSSSITFKTSHVGKEDPLAPIYKQLVSLREKIGNTLQAAGHSEIFSQLSAAMEVYSKGLVDSSPKWLETLRPRSPRSPSLSPNIRFPLGSPPACSPVGSPPMSPLLFSPSSLFTLDNPQDVTNRSDSQGLNAPQEMAGEPPVSKLIPAQDTQEMTQLPTHEELVQISPSISPSPNPPASPPSLPLTFPSYPPPSLLIPIQTPEQLLDSASPPSFSVESEPSLLPVADSNGTDEDRNTRDIEELMKKKVEEIRLLKKRLESKEFQDATERTAMQTEFQSILKYLKQMNEKLKHLKTEAAH